MINPKKNYQETMLKFGYVSQDKATVNDYKQIGFKSGLEVHQQLISKRKLFCHCPAGIYHKDHEYDAEIIRHMRPTLSEMGEYDGTALMEFKTRKEITYRINNQTACTYEIDDTPPFPIDREALEYALEISHLCNLNIVGEVHITRKQYLDGSIPTGFQRTAILGVEGTIHLSNKLVRILQLSIEEDACREISDVRHKRVYKTDRLGMPLIETVTYPDMNTPDELREAAEYIRFLNRSTGKVRIGIGSGREDVNVSCAHGTRVEIKGVAHTQWIPVLSHNEAFRQVSLLHIQKILNQRIKNPKKWKINHTVMTTKEYDFRFEPIKLAAKNNWKILILNIPFFKGVLSAFTQPGKCFANELSDRLKVIACIEKPNMISSEDISGSIDKSDLVYIQTVLGSKDQDAQIVVWGPSQDIPTALETVEERCCMAFEGVPNETRKACDDGTTIFERVLPGANRMYPDTDSVPIPLKDEYINPLQKNLPIAISKLLKKIKKWKIPKDTYSYILRNNLAPIIERIYKSLNISPRFAAPFFGHSLKCIEGHYHSHPDFNYGKIYDLFRFLQTSDLDLALAKPMIPVVYEHPNMDFDSVLININFNKRSISELMAPVDYLIETFKKKNNAPNPDIISHWIMGQLNELAVGNIPLKQLKDKIDSRIQGIYKK